MKRLITLVSLVLCLAAPLAGAYISPVAAYNPLDQACAVSGQNNPAASVGCTGRTTTDPVSGSNGVLRKVTTLIAILAGVAAVIIIIMSGFSYITAAGDPQKAAAAKNSLIGAIVGLVVIAVAQGVIVFVLSKV